MSIQKEARVRRIFNLCFAFILQLLPMACFALEYPVEPCCQLCPAASDPSIYESGRMRGMRMLVDGKNGWMFRTKNDFMDTFGPDEASLKDLTTFVSKMNDSDMQLMIVYIPTRGLMHAEQISDKDIAKFNVEKARAAYEDALIKLRQTGALVPNLSATYREPLDEDFYFKRDHHWTPEGAKYSAKLIAEYLRAQPIYDELVKTDFETSINGVFRRRGQFQLAAKQLCGFDYPAQYPVRYLTETAVSSDVSADALFGDTSLPEVVLLGTSNSWNGNQDFNFSGFLREYLQVDILNESITGGNFDGSLMQYFVSDSFRESKPKLVIWELPSYYDLVEDEFYRRVIPMVDRGCDTRDVVLSSKTTLKIGRNEILFNGKDGVKRLKNKQLIVDLRFDNPGFRDFSGYVWYVHGRREPFSFHLSERVNTEGRYIFEISMLDDPEDFLYLSTDLYVPKDTAISAVPSHVEARMCLKDYH